jgi:hypothetical protein
LEVIVDNEQGLIKDRTIALRPYPALKLFRDAMYASLKDKLPPDVWDYPAPTTSTPQQYVAGITDFGPGRSKPFSNGEISSKEK